MRDVSARELTIADSDGFLVNQQNIQDTKSLSLPQYLPGDKQTPQTALVPRSSHSVRFPPAPSFGFLLPLPRDRKVDVVGTCFSNQTILSRFQVVQSRPTDSCDNAILCRRPLPSALALVLKSFPCAAASIHVSAGPGPGAGMASRADGVREASRYLHSNLARCNTDPRSVMSQRGASMEHRSTEATSVVCVAQKSHP
jgi:hypothetical protein